MRTPPLEPIGLSDPPDLVEVILPPLDGANIHPGDARLHACADLVSAHDRLAAQVVTALVRLRDDATVRERTGVADDEWLAIVGRMPGIDARRMVRVARSLSRLPRLLSCLQDGRIAYATAATLAAEIRRAPAAHRDHLDAVVEAYITEHGGRLAPDQLIDAVAARVVALAPSRLEREEAAAERSEFVVLTPFAFGGGSIYGEFGTEHFARLAEALDAPLDPPTLDRAMLQELTEAERAETFDELDRQRRQLARTHGAAMAAQLAEVAGSWLAGHVQTGRRSRPTAILTIDVDTLLGDREIPGWLLHTLAGGRMRTSARLQRELIDRDGADIRLVVLDDDNEVVGVGRKSRVAPGWLREAIFVRDLADRHPGGHTAVRRCDLDHETPWYPTPGSDRPPGRTDADNLAPLGRRGHSGKTARRWQMSRARDGTTTWTYRPTGWTVTCAPERTPPLDA